MEDFEFSEFGAADLERFPIIRSHILRRRSSFGILLV